MCPSAASVVGVCVGLWSGRSRGRCSRTWCTKIGQNMSTHCQANVLVSLKNDQFVSMPSSVNSWRSNLDWSFSFQPAVCFVRIVKVIGVSFKWCLLHPKVWPKMNREEKGGSVPWTFDICWTHEFSSNDQMRTICYWNFETWWDNWTVWWFAQGKTNTALKSWSENLEWLMNVLLDHFSTAQQCSAEDFCFIQLTFPFFTWTKVLHLFVFVSFCDSVHSDYVATCWTKMWSTEKKPQTTKLTVGSVQYEHSDTLHFFHLESTKDVKHCLALVFSCRVFDHILSRGPAFIMTSNQFHCWNYWGQMLNKLDWHHKPPFVSALALFQLHNRHFMRMCRTSYCFFRTKSAFFGSDINHHPPALQLFGPELERKNCSISGNAQCSGISKHGLRNSLPRSTHLLIASDSVSALWHQWNWFNEIDFWFSINDSSGFNLEHLIRMHFVCLPRITALPDAHGYFTFRCFIFIHCFLPPNWAISLLHDFCAFVQQWAQLAGWT